MCGPRLPSVGMSAPSVGPPVAVKRPVRTVALVGVDGSGKTTQARLLAAALAGAGHPAVYRQNAGGRAWFGRLAARWGRGDAEGLFGRRGMLLIESLLRWLAIARTLLRRAVRHEIAVMDRYAACQFASLRARGAGPAAERRARLAYRLFPRPDVTFLLAVDPAVARERIDRRGTDRESIEYLTAADRAYRSLPEAAGFVVIDANGSPEQVHAAIRAGLAAAMVSQAVPAAAGSSAMAAGSSAVAAGSSAVAGTTPGVAGTAPGAAAGTAAVAGGRGAPVAVSGTAGAVAAGPAGATPGRRRVRVRTLVLAGVPAVAGAAVIGWQLAESL